jgi:hypothetical protein
MSTRPMIRLRSGDVSARKTYDLMDEPVGADYRALLNCALANCDTAVLSVDAERPLDDAGQELVERLRPRLASETSLGSTRLMRLRFDREGAELLAEAAPSLFSWQQPDRPENLSLLRNDGSPWLVSIASERLGYVELAPFEKLLLGRAAPGLAAVLAHQGARDAILASFERRLESVTDALEDELTAYAGSVVDEGREGLVDALREWLESGEQVRVGAAAGVVGAMRLHELIPEVRDLLDSLEAEAVSVPAVYRSNFVLRERWKARFERQLHEVRSTLDEARRG